MMIIHDDFNNERDTPVCQIALSEKPSIFSRRIRRNQIPVSCWSIGHGWFTLMHGTESASYPFL